jgi:hypothetical protein
LTLDLPDATSCFLPLRADEKNPLERHLDAPSLFPGRPSFFPSPWLGLSLPHIVLAHSNPWLPPRAVVPCLPLLLREAEKVPDAALFLLARRIEPECPKSPRIPRRRPKPPPPNSSSPVILRPSQPHRRVPGEPLLRPPPFSSSSRAVAPAMAGRRRCLGAGQAGRAQPTWSTVASLGGPGPPSQPLWVI